MPDNIGVNRQLNRQQNGLKAASSLPRLGLQLLEPVFDHDQDASILNNRHHPRTPLTSAAREKDPTRLERTTGLSGEQTLKPRIAAQRIPPRVDAQLRNGHIARNRKKLLEIGYRLVVRSGEHRVAGDSIEIVRAAYRIGGQGRGLQREPPLFQATLPVTLRGVSLAEESVEAGVEKISPHRFWRLGDQRMRAERACFRCTH
jgi:hypothetical protein